MYAFIVHSLHSCMWLMFGHAQYFSFLKIIIIIDWEENHIVYTVHCTLYRRIIHKLLWLHLFGTSKKKNSCRFLTNAMFIICAIRKIYSVWMMIASSWKKLNVNSSIRLIFFVLSWNVQNKWFRLGHNHIISTISCFSISQKKIVHLNSLSSPSRLFVVYKCIMIYTNIMLCIKENTNHKIY